jgi:FkbM family methyltransferase
MSAPPEPRPVTEPLPSVAPGNAAVRALRAVFVEHRLPTRLDETKERLLVALGRPAKTVSADGLRFRVRRLAADEHFVGDVMNGTYAPPGYEVRETDTVLDIGANVGAFAVWAAKRAPRGRVIALEPASENFALLEQNIRLNDQTNVMPLKAALADHGGTVTLHLAERSSGDHSIDPAVMGPSRGKEEVEAVTLAGLLDRLGLAACDLIKFNCEGAEVPVVLGLDAPTAARLRRMILGYHVDPSRPKRPQADALVRKLLGLGFVIDDYTDVLGTHRGTILARRT